MPFFDLFKNDTDIIEIESGKTLFREGDPGDVMYVLVDGEAEIFIGGVLFEKCTPGAILGEIAVIDKAPRYATVIASGKCKFAQVDDKRFHFLLDETPGFAIAIMRVMAERLKRCDLRVIQSAK